MGGVKKMAKKFVLMFLFFVMLVSSVDASSPVLFFSDLTSGPNTGGQDGDGVFVTIFGNNFGATRGSSYITVGGGQVASYQVWGENNANNPNLDMITFQLGNNSATGDIVLHTAEGDSNGLPFTVRVGNIYYVDINTDASGDGSFTDPWDSPNDFYNDIVAGDTCYIRGGEYTAQYGYGIGTWRSNICTDQAKTGTESNPVAWIGYLGETAVFSGQDVCFRTRQATNYWVVSNLGMTPNQNGITTSGTGWRIINNLVDLNYGGTYEGIGGGGTSTKIYGNEIINGGGSNLLHCVYMGYGHTDFDIGWNYGHDNTMGFQIQVHQDGGEHTFSGKIHDNILDCGSTSRGITVSSVAAGTEVDIYNNIIIDGHPSGFGGINVQSSNANVNIYNNNIYSILNNVPGILINWGGSGEIRNNILYLHDAVEYIKEGNGGDRGNFIISNNCFYGSTAITYGTNKIEADPLFIDTINRNFQLLVTSPAIDAGTSSVSSIVTQDLDGIFRPQNFLFDIGAYEYDFVSPPQNCTDAGGICQTNSCSIYQNCSSLTGTCSSGNCCLGTCTEITCIDSDGDGYNQSQTGCGTADCNDSNPLVYPGATETCGNGIDEDCDGNDLNCTEDTTPPISQTSWQHLQQHQRR